MKLNTKMLLGIGIPLTIITAVLVNAFIVTGGIKKSAKYAQVESVVFASTAQQMKLDVVQIQQWLTDISATRAQDGLDDGFDEAQKSKKSFLAGLARFKEMYVSKNNKKGLSDLTIIERSLESYYATGKKMAQAYIDGGAAEGNKLMDRFDKASVALTDKLEPFINQQTSELNTSMATIVSSVNRLKMIIMITSFPAIVISIVIGNMIAQSISKSIDKVITDLSTGSEQVTSASEQISCTSQTLAEGATEQATMAVTNTNHVKATAKLVDKCNEYADNGSRQIEQMNSSMEDIKTSNMKIAEFTKVIDDIANKTDLLAVNAAIEAANAGDHGKGFSVVAEEVRNLAQRSATAAKETSTLINISVDKTVTGAELAKECKKAMDDIKDATVEQKERMHQINLSSQEIDSVTQQNAATAEETASASEELSAQAQAIMVQVDELSRQIRGADDTKLSITKKAARQRQKYIKDPSKQRNRRANSVGNGESSEAFSFRKDAESLIPMGTDND